MFRWRNINILKENALDNVRGDYDYDYSLVSVNLINLLSS